MNIINPCQHLKFLNQQVSWTSMSWEVRGMAMALMALGDFENEHLGTLPAEDDLWRNILNIPTQRSIQEALKRSVNGRGVRVQNELDTVWHDVWKVELLRWFLLIDDSFVVSHPKYQGCRGRYWHPLLEEIFVDLTNGRELNKRGSGMTRQRKGVTQEVRSNLEGLIQTQKDSKKPRIKVGEKSSAKGKRGKKEIDPIWDYPVIRYTPVVIKACWEAPMSKEARSSLWQTAVSFLSIAEDAQSEATSRQFVGKLIKEFGERKVAVAIAEMVIRPIKPADPKAFLRRQLKNITEGSEAVQRARAQRIKVPL